MFSDLPKDRKLHIHFVGIGGISMSGIAHVLLKKGYQISGSDTTLSKITDKLVKEGAVVYKGHNQRHVTTPDLIVHTSAVDENNPELLAAKEKDIKIVDRASFLGKLMKEFKYSVSVAGAHGKTTTTSMVSLLLFNAGMDPTVLIGGELDKIGGNVRTGGSSYFVTEACEYKENFLKFHPYIAVILNIDVDHLDYFKDFEHIKSAFIRFAQLVPDYGWTVLYTGDSNLMNMKHSLSCNVITFGLEEDADIRGDNLSFDDRGYPSFDLIHKNRNLGKINLNIPGSHNVLNALATCAVASIFDIEFNVLKKTLVEFSGTHRRFEIKGEYKGATIVDDYAHHPAEIKATLEAASKYPHNNIWCVFQPHTYTRTKFLLKEFSQSFYKADKVIIADIYAAREKDTGEIHSTDLVKEINKTGQDVLYLSEFEDIALYLSQNIKDGDLVLTVGAGNVYRVGEILLEGDF